MSTRRLTSLDTIIWPERHGISYCDGDTHDPEVMRQFKRIIAQTSAEMFGGGAGTCTIDDMFGGFWELQMLDDRGRESGTALLHETLAFVALYGVRDESGPIRGYLDVSVLEKYCDEPFFVLPPEILDFEINPQDVNGNRKIFGNNVALLMRSIGCRSVGGYVFNQSFPRD